MATKTSAVTELEPRVVALAATVIVLAFFAIDTLRNAPETFVAIVLITVLAVVLDFLWKRARGPLV